MMKVKECMCNDVACLKPENTVSDCAKLMCDKHVGCIPVCDNDNCVVGLVTDRDLILRSIACDKDVKSTKLSDVMSCKVCCCSSDAEVEEAEKLMCDNQIRRIPIVDNNKIVGILTLGDLAAHEKVEEDELCDTIENICGCNDHNAE